LTTVALDQYAWGQRLMRYLLQIISGAEERSGTCFPKDLLEPVYLIRRESTAAPRTGSV